MRDRLPTLSISTICQDEDSIIGWFLECCLDVGNDILREVVFVDGGSKDHTIDLIRSYSDVLPIKIIEHPFDTFGRQRNRGLEQCTGDWVFWPDADSSWSTNLRNIILTGNLDRARVWAAHAYQTGKDACHYYAWEGHYPLNARLFKREGAWWTTDFHEKIGYPSPEKLAQIKAIDPYGCPGGGWEQWSRDPNRPFYVFENCLRQSDEKLLHRGARYQRFSEQLIAAGNGPGPPNRFYDGARLTQYLVKFPDSIISLINPRTNVPVLWQP